MANVRRTYHDITKSENDKRSYRCLELNNGLKVLLISDPTTEKSAAALDVHIGSMSDPLNLPGLAHFCEHMLLLGSEKFPDEDEYEKFLNLHSGSFNAFTSSDHTNYYFDVAPEHLSGAIDRFSPFFLSPLFTESATDREVNAVNSEHEKNIPNDYWRINQIERALVDSKHDFSKFGTGNKDTLDILPKEKGVSVRESLLEFHSTWYSSNIMSLVILGREDLDSLQDLVLTSFNGVKDNTVVVPEWTNAPFTDDDCGTLTYVVPVKDIRSLKIKWGIPDMTSQYQTLPCQYIADLLGHEGPGSLLSELKNQGWVNSLGAGPVGGTKGFWFFVVNVQMTKEGIEHVFDIIQMVFQYLAMLKSQGPQQWIFKERQDLQAIKFKYKDKEEPQSYVSRLAGDLHDYPVLDVLTGGHLLSSWRPELITEVLDQLTPQRMRVFVSAQKYAEKCKEKEKWYGAKYKSEKIPEKMVGSLSNCGFHENLRLPDKNDFIPSDFSQATRDVYPGNHPTIIQEDSMGRLWFKQDNEFFLPKNYINIALTSPIAYFDPQHANLTYMFSAVFMDELNEYLYDAELAGIDCSLYATFSGVILTVSGYSDKQGALLNKIVDKLTKFKVDTVRFDRLKERFTRNLKNFGCEQPHHQSKLYARHLLYERFWDLDEMIGAMPDLTVQTLENFLPKFFGSIHVECLVYGNCTASLALSLYNSVADKLKDGFNAKCLLPSQMTRMREVELKDSYSLSVNTNSIHKSSSIYNVYQCGMQSTKQNMLLELFCQIIDERFFTQLRTKEQLGYVVGSGARSSNGTLGIGLIVQSDKKPEFLDKRIENFIHDMAGTLEAMDKTEFNQHVEALAKNILEKPKRMNQRNGRYWSEIWRKQFNFNRDEVEVACLKSLSKDEIISFYTQHIANNKSRKKLSCHVVSTCEKDAEENESSTEVNEMSAEDSSLLKSPDTHLITNVTSFKATLPLFPLLQPFVHPEVFKRPTSSKTEAVVED